MSTIKRRTMLRGFGLCMGLPLLEIMPATSLANSGIDKNPTRMAFVFFANGAIMDSWKPTTSGSQYELPRTLKQLEEHKLDCYHLPRKIPRDRDPDRVDAAHQPGALCLEAAHRPGCHLAGRRRR